MNPVASNVVDQRCANPIGSDCVTMSVPVAGTCAGATLSQAITAISGIGTPCYTGNWVDFSSSIPLSGSVAGVTWAIGPFGEGNTGTPSYKWTKEGDLKLRGGFVFKATTTTSKTYFDIPLVSLPTSCFPANWVKNQGIVTFVDFSPVNDIIVSTRAVVYIGHPSGILYFNFTFANTILSPMSCEIDLGGTTFNLA